jgi:hypothetical protein
MIIHSHAKNQVNISKYSEKKVVTTKYLAKFQSSRPTYSRWALKFGQIFSCHHFFSLCLEILTWCLVYECIMMSYRSSLHFIPVQWFLAELWPLNTKYFAKFQSPSAVSWSKIIQLEGISKLICNLWLYTLIPKIKSISQIIVK